MSSDLIADSRRIIATQFDLDFDADDAALESREDAFRALLVNRLIALLNHDMERLMHILYRIDVPEDKVQRILHELPHVEMAPALADLIIDRQMKKARTRAAFRSRD